ncbi:secretion system type I outer membrane efflux pump lipoprotein NodT [Ameyamaea chiangmaiensis NBRC 103196]|uniref:Efflux transporter outer membrane subunit n=1 Tax=Ameyamaea chiangmaiensis TaxID=442969 RepID=A0A850P962_9PROT|nr:efflux transporter outer membrane subunit [Ameyamaea chiangmaiensis]MBS4074167.1 efflux transporter outer membrane subunit [Ameyamaea chiangmaiensis]NVN39110.1 efflux transporter outer membrane subunit [Ameyamaea chiangmaiensis]GBQ71113.1 secretion system type I outer membrane efflux pump lipoprotein NodT [Ameyamaea chiangmaiensis NBRC 103196]
MRPLSTLRVLRGTRRAVLVPGCAMLALLSGCDLAPAYHPPALTLPAAWGEDPVMRTAHPDDAALRPDWWTMFGDPVLDRLEAQATEANPDLNAAAESFTQSRDIAREAESKLYPQLTGGASGYKYKSSRKRLYRGGTATGPIYMSSEQYWAAASWEPDFWDSIRNQTRVRKAYAQQKAADYALARLSIQAELATDYMALRGLDAQHAVYTDSIAYYQTAVQITKMRQAGDIAAGIDVSRAQNQLYATQAADTDILAQRSVLEHAIAVLVNVAPGAFHLEPVPSLSFRPVALGAGVPSTLLERRPDIAGAERAVEQANRAIGITRAAYYPHITFNAMTGFMDNGFDLASLSNAMYQFGVGAVLPLFQGGLRRAELQRSWSQYRQAQDEYRATVLDAFQDVEDGLSLRTRLQTEAQQQEQAVGAAMRTQRMSMALYTGGLTNYLDVVVAQVAALTARIAEVKVQAEHLQATVRLIRALGGGWSRAELPGTKTIDPFGPLQYDGLHHPRPTGGIPVDTPPSADDLTRGGLTQGAKSR